MSGSGRGLRRSRPVPVGQGCPSSSSDRHDRDDRDERGADGWQGLAVPNPTFLLERPGSECGDLQFLRELTVNGPDAIAALPQPKGGRVVWDLD
jgi:hypothetical protein